MAGFFIKGFGENKMLSCGTAEAAFEVWRFVAGGGGAADSA
jgi:hypothetical protein